MALLKARNLRKTYRVSRQNVVHALRGVDVTVDAGEMLGIVGPSGSGKSTLMHILGLLQLPDEDFGCPPSLLFDGTDVAKLPDRVRTRMRAERIGFVFQAFNLVPTLTAAENVALPAEYAGQQRSAARSAAAEALKGVGMEPSGTPSLGTLWRGTAAVAIARALVTRPALLLADEPTGNLDLESTEELLELLRGYNLERQQTMVFVTHDPRVSDACKRVLIMRDGVLEER